MTINERINAFAQLGGYIENLTSEELEELQARAAAENPWFTPDNVKSALDGITMFLNKQKLEDWVTKYTIKDKNKIVGIVMAGNIPLVGFHDLLAVVISGNIAKVKLSSKDSSLIRHLVAKLTTFNNEIENKIIYADQLKQIDAIIATGSDNSSRYFEYYFAKYPNIIRKNRTSVAILDKTCDKNDFRALGDDIFKYYGLGCRNVSKLYVPNAYNFDAFFEALSPFESVKHHHKYNNNYDYNKSIYLVNGEPHLDNGFLLLKEDVGLVSPISVLFYESYVNEEHLRGLLETNRDKIQCVVSKEGQHPQSFPFGQAQYPSLTDYADGIDTMKFLTEL